MHVFFSSNVSIVAVCVWFFRGTVVAKDSRSEGGIKVSVTFFVFDQCGVVYTYVRCWVSVRQTRNLESSVQYKGWKSREEAV